MAANDISTAEDLQSFISQQRSLISRTELKPFTRRTDSHGLIYLAIHFAGLGATGWLIYLSLGNWWLLVPAMFVHGVVLSRFELPSFKAAAFWSVPPPASRCKKTATIDPSR